MLAPNLIFDLGAVLYEINFDAMFSAFDALLGGGQMNRVHDAVQTHPAWKAFERGEMSPADFRDAIRKHFEIQVADEAIDAAWNALLVGPIPGRVELLSKLAREHELIILSNTNAIHYAHLLPQCQDLFLPFRRQFLSFEMGLRKPDPAIYGAVLEAMDWEGKDCLFFDDGLENVRSARAFGLPAIQVEGRESPGLEEVLAECKGKGGAELG